MKYITIETPLTDYYHKNVYEVETEFKDMGFTDITKKSTQNKLGSQYNNNVKVVTIDGKQDYAVGDEVTSDSPVEIEYLGTYSTGQYTSSEPTVDGSDTTTDNSTEEKDTSGSNDTSSTQQDSSSSSDSSETAFPSKTVTFNTTDYNGYEITEIFKLGYWVKASDREAVAKAWEQVGGRGDPPVAKQFQKGLQDGNSAIAFGTVSLENTTSGFDVTEDNSRSVMIGTIKAYIDNPDTMTGYSSVGCSSLIEFTRGYQDFDGSALAKMESNNWGPAPIAILIPNVFTPKNGEDGMGLMENLSLTITGNGGWEGDIVLPISWR